MGREYTCAHCGETYKAEWTEEEALAECEQIWGVKNANDREDMAVVCDDCFKMMKEKAPMGPQWVNDG